MIGILEWEIRALDTTLTVTGGTISVDDQNIPAITSTVTVPFDPALFDGLDPRQTPVPRVVLSGTLSEWASQPLSVMSEYAASEGGTIADLSAAWSGLQIRDVSEMFGAPMQAAASSTPQTMSLDLHVREIQADDFEMVINLASDEALLLDWTPAKFEQITEIRDFQVGLPANRVSTYVDSVLQYLLGRPTDVNVYSATTLISLPTDIMQWSLYPTAWDMIRPALEDADLKLRVNPTGTGFTLQRPENYINEPATHSWLFTAENVTSARRVYTRSGDWYDAALLISEDGTVKRGHPAAPHSRTWREQLSEGMTPSDSMAQNIVTRASNRGRVIDLVAPIRLGVFMRDQFTYLPEGATPGPDYQWIVKSVSYDLPTATMRIRGEHRY